MARIRALRMCMAFPVHLKSAEAVLLLSKLQIEVGLFRLDNVRRRGAS
jgi:hypothetical protein